MIDFERDGYAVEVEYPKWVRIVGGPVGSVGDYRVSVRKLPLVGPFLWAGYRDVAPKVAAQPGRCRLRGKLQRRGFFRPTVDPPAAEQLSELVDRAIALAESAIDQSEQTRLRDEELKADLTASERSG